MHYFKYLKFCIYLLGGFLILAPPVFAEPLEACFNVDGFGNKTESGALKVELNADCSTGNNITTYKWNVSNGEKGEGNPSEVIFEEEGVYTITLEITDGEGNTDSESKQVPILGGLCAEFELPSEIRFNGELLKYPLVETCAPTPPYFSIDYQWEIVSSNLECDEIKPIIGGGVYRF